MFGYVTLPSNFVGLVSTSAGEIFTNLAPVAMLIAGVLLGLFAINYVLSMFAQAREEAHFTSEAVSEYENLLDEETGD